MSFWEDTFIDDLQPKLPYDIFTVIVDAIVASNDSQTALSTLQTLCLVCKLFLFICRPRLFTNVTIGPVGKQSKAQKRLQKALDRCQLSIHVRNLTYFMDHDAAMEERCVPQEGDTFPSFPNLQVLEVMHGPDKSIYRRVPCALCDDRLLKVIQVYGRSHHLTTLRVEAHGKVSMSLVFSIPSLEDLSLIYCRNVEGWTSTSDGHPVTSNQFRSPLRLKRIQLVDIDNFSYTLLQCCPNLQSILHPQGTLNIRDLVPDFVDVSLRRFSFFQLHNLELHRPSLWAPVCKLAEGSKVIAFPNVRNLKITVFSWELSGTNTLLRHFSRLETIFCIVENYDDFDALATLDLPACLFACASTLSCLTLDSKVGECHELALRALVDGLICVQGANSISVLTILLQVVPSLDWRQGHAPSRMYHQLSRLDTLLAGDSKRDFSALKSVVVSVELPGVLVGFDSITDAWTATTRGLMMESLKGLLSPSFHIKFTYKFEIV